jgi:hypothetical protein
VKGALGKLATNPFLFEPKELTHKREGEASIEYKENKLKGQGGWNFHVVGESDTLLPL